MDNPICDELERYSKSLLMKLKIENKSKHTVEAYNRTYCSFIDFCKQYHKKMTFNNIKEDDIYAFIQFKNDMLNKHTDISESTKNSLVVHLKRLFKHIERNSEEILDFDRVFEDIKLKQPNRKPKGLNKEEIHKLTNYLENMKAKETFVVFRNAFLIKLMLFGGLRASEAISIKLSNIELEDDDFYKITFTGKGDKKRTTYIKHNILDDEMDYFVNEFNIDRNSFIATTQNNKILDRVQLSKAVNSIYKKAGIKANSCHILRHTFAKELLNQDVSIVVVQGLLGHSSIQTTSIYTNPTDSIIKSELLKSQRSL